VAVVLVLLAAGCGSKVPLAMKPLPKPKDVPLESVTTAPPADLAETKLPAARGTTSTVVVLGPGPLTLTGRVDGPDGVVPGASVRVERVVGGVASGADLITGPDGTWVLPNVLGGRYRVRAWQAPALAMERAKVFFVGTSLAAPIVLRVDRYQGRTVDEAMAPSPPPLGQPVELRVRVSTRAVAGNGRVSAAPAPGVQISLAGSGQWQSDSPVTTFTGDDGVAVWQVRCQAPGKQPLSVVLDGVDAVALDVGDCIDYSTTTTSSTTPTATTSSTSTTSTTVKRSR